MKVTTYTNQNKKWSKEPDSKLDSEHSVLMIFGNDKDLAHDLIKKFPKSYIFGCSTAGNIVDTTHTMDMTATLVQFQNSKLKLASRDVSSYEDAFSSGKSLMEELIKGGEKLKACLIIATGFVNGNQVVAGMNEVSLGKVNIFGGMAGDPEIKNTWIFTRSGEKASAVLALGIYGDAIELTSASVAGVTPIGTERTITKVKDNTILEIDNKKAVTFYEDFLGDKIHAFHQLAVQYPVAVSNNFQTDKDGLVRTPFGVNPDGSIPYTGEIHAGEKVRLMFASAENLTDGSEQAADQIAEKIKPQEDADCLLLAISCLTRKMVLGNLLEDELEAVGSPFEKQKNVKICGFYSFGEISSSSGKTKLYNQTMNLGALYEKKVA